MKKIICLFVLISITAFCQQSPQKTTGSDTISNSSLGCLTVSDGSCVPLLQAPVVWNGSNWVRLSGTTSGLNVNAANATDATASGTITASGSSNAVCVNMAGNYGAQVTLSGTWSATVQASLKAADNSTIINSFFFNPATASTPVTSTTTSNGSLSIVVAGGSSAACVYASAFTSGTITVSLRATTSQTLADVVNVNQIGGTNYALGQAVAASSQPVVLPSAQLPNTGQAAMASSVPVAIANNQSAVPSNVTQLNGVATSVGNGTTDTGTLRVSLSSDSTGQVKETNLPTTVDTNSGVKSASTLRVVLATDQPQLTNKLLVTPDSVALPANQSVNVAQVGGTNTDTNSGTKSAGTIRVVLATDQPQLTNKLLVTPDSVALPANQSVNISQVNGTTTSTNSGTSDAGTLRVVPATNQPFPTLNGAPSGSNAAGGFQDAGGVARPGAVSIFPTSNATNAIGPTVNGSVGSSLVLKASAGNLYDAYVNATAAGLLMVFDATSAPGDGAVTPKHCIPTSAIGGMNFASLTFGSGPPESYASGITVVFSSGTNCFNKTASAVAFIHGRFQ